MRVVKFGMVGVANTLVDFAVFNLLAVVLGVPVAAANVVSFSAGVANSWFWNSRWTFGDRQPRSERMAGATFVAVNVAGLVINTATVLLLVWAGEQLGADETLGVGVFLNACKAAAVAVSFAWNYLATRRFVFA
jgi:putative flippase GtrA